MGCCASTPVEATSALVHESSATKENHHAPMNVSASPNAAHGITSGNESIEQELVGFNAPEETRVGSFVCFTLPAPSRSPSVTPINLASRYLPLTPPSRALSCPTAGLSGSYGNIAQVPMSMPHQSPKSMKSSRRTLKHGSSIYAACENPLNGHATETNTVLTARDEDDISEGQAICATSDVPSPSHPADNSPSAPTTMENTMNDSRPLLSFMNGLDSQSGAGLRRDTESIWVDSEAMTVRMQNVVWGEAGLFRSPLNSCGATQSVGNSCPRVAELPPAAPLTAMALTQVTSLDNAGRPQFVQAVNTWRLSVAVAAKHAVTLE